MAVLEQSVPARRDQMSGSDSGLVREAAVPGPAVLIVDDDAAIRTFLK